MLNTITVKATMAGRRSTGNASPRSPACRPRRTNQYNPSNVRTMPRGKAIQISGLSMCISKPTRSYQESQPGHGETEAGNQIGHDQATLEQVQSAPVMYPLIRRVLAFSQPRVKREITAAIAATKLKVPYPDKPSHRLRVISKPSKAATPKVRTSKILRAGPLQLSRARQTARPIRRSAVGVRSSRCGHPWSLTDPRLHGTLPNSPACSDLNEGEC